MRRIIFIGLLLLFGGCQHKAPREVANAFYYWKSGFEIRPPNITLLTSLHVRTLYLKFFDVDWPSDADQPVPIAAAQFNTPIPAGFELIPTIFITKAGLEHLPKPEVTLLADHITGKIGEMLKPLTSTPVREIQIDCDWTNTTRSKYFALLRQMQANLAGRHADFNIPPNIILSATLRLHQIKYPQKTGVPPVARGMLMCYNMGALTKRMTRNSILELATAKAYLSNLAAYPLPLDVALPLFSWGVVFQHNQFARLINNVHLQEIRDQPAFEMVQENVFRVKQNTILRGQYLAQDTLIRVEEVSAADCRQAAAMIAAQLPNASVKVALFHFDNDIVQHYTQQELEGIYAQF
jgi:hypothetical protein